MNKFKVGDKVIPQRIDGRVHEHLTGSKSYVVEGNVPESVGLIWLIDDTDRKCMWAEEWFKLSEENKQMTAEQLREEIIRIDARIEEAKKDIENAQTERSSLVEKLREKGFEMVEKTTQLSDRPFLEIGAHYVINDKNSSTWMEKGTEVRCVDIDPSSRKLDARVEDHLGNDDWVNSECLTKI